MYSIEIPATRRPREASTTPANIIQVQSLFKETVQLTSCFFHHLNLPGPMRNGLKYFRFCLRIRRAFQHKMYQLTRRGIIPREDWLAGESNPSEISKNSKSSANSLPKSKIFWHIDKWQGRFKWWIKLEFKISPMRVMLLYLYLTYECYPPIFISHLWVLFTYSICISHIWALSTYIIISHLWALSTYIHISPMSVIHLYSYLSYESYPPIFIYHLYESYPPIFISYLWELSTYGRISVRGRPLEGHYQELYSYLTYESDPPMAESLYEEGHQRTATKSEKSHDGAGHGCLCSSCN